MAMVACGRPFLDNEPRFRQLKSQSMEESHRQMADLVRGVVDHSPIERVFVTGDRLQPPTLAFVVHFPILVVPISGRYEFEMERKNDYARLWVKTGQAVFSPPNCWFKPTWQRPTRALHLLFGKDHVGASLVTTDRQHPGDVIAEKLAVPRSFGGPAHKTLDAILETTQNNSNSAAAAHLVSALLHCISEELRQTTKRPMGRTKRLYQDLCVYLQHNYHQNVTRESTAAHFRITPSHVSRIFRSEGLMRFSEYLTAVRIDRAKLLLKRYRLTVSEVATRCGYAEVGYFCRVFKRFTKTTPSEYRQKTVTQRQRR